MALCAANEAAMSRYEKIALVVRKTRLAELIERFNTYAQAIFYITHAGLDFDHHQREDEAYRRSLEQLVWVVREPYVSRHSSARQAAGVLAAGQSLRLESLMPSGGVVFSDGMEADSLQFNAGVTVEVRPAEQRAQLVA